MTHFTLIEEGEPVGYVDTDSLDYEYNGDDDLVASALEDLGTSVGMSPDDLYGEEVFLEGERADEYIREIADDELTAVSVQERD